MSISAVECRAEVPFHGFIWPIRLTRDGGYLCIVSISQPDRQWSSTAVDGVVAVFGRHPVILDEPTAALDARAEFEVFQRFKELSRGKTTVLISHRFSSVRMADRIIVLANGKVEASGTHDELITQSGRYAELFEIQAAGYR